MLKRQHQTGQRKTDDPTLGYDVKKLKSKKIKMDFKYDPQSDMWYGGPKPPSEIVTSNEPPPLHKKTDKMIMRRLEADVPLPQTAETKGYNLRQFKAKNILILLVLGKSN